MKINSVNLNFMKTTHFFIKTIFCASLLIFTGCSDDDPEPINEEEFITDVILTFTNDADSSDTVVLTSIAPDGQDGEFTNYSEGNFTSGETYSLSLELYNATQTPPVDVLNGDVIPEAGEHFFVYAVSGINLTMTRDTSDEDGLGGTKLGVSTTWIAGAPSMGSIRIQLIHLPVTADDSDNFGSATGGSDDLNITFTNVEIQ